MGKEMDRFIAFHEWRGRSGEGNIVELTPPSATEIETKRLTPLQLWFWICSWACFWIGLCLAVPAGFFAGFFIGSARCGNYALCAGNGIFWGFFGVFIGPVVYVVLVRLAIRLGKRLGGDWRGFPWVMD